MTIRAILLGAVLCVGLGIALPVAEFYIQGTRLGLSSATPAAFFLLFVMLIGPQLLLRWVKPRWSLSRGELLTVFVMMSVAIVPCTRGLTGPLFGITAGPAYFAQGAVPWAMTISEHLGPPFAVADAEAVRRMYEGGRIPWELWAGPMAWWGMFVLCMTTLVLSAVALFRRQWVENEHLPFPVARVALALTEEDSSRALLPALFRSRVFWIGFAIPAALESVNGLHAYFPTAVPAVTLSATIALQSELVTDPVIRLSFLMLGFAFFIDCRVAFSLWAFFLLTLPMESIYKLAFFGHAEELGNWTAHGPHGTIMGHQQMGAMLVLVAGMVWAARRHILHEKGALVLFVASFVAMSVLVAQMGAPSWVAPIMVGSALVIWLSLTRLMAQGGLATIVPAIVPLGFVISAVGTPWLGTMGLIAAGLTTVWAGDLLTFQMGPAANSAFLATEASGTRPTMLLPLLLAVMLAFVASAYVTLRLSYSMGALNLHQQYFQWFPEVTWEVVASKLARSTGPSWCTGWCRGGPCTRWATSRRAAGSCDRSGSRSSWPGWSRRASFDSAAGASTRRPRTCSSGSLSACS